MNCSDKLRTIQELARGIVAVCSEYSDAESRACMKSANEIFELAEQLHTTQEMEVHYGLGMDGRESDADRVSGNREELRNVRYKADAKEEGRSRHCRQSLLQSQAARQRTQKAKAKRRRGVKR